MAEQATAPRGRLVAHAEWRRRWWRRQAHSAARLEQRAWDRL